MKLLPSYTTADVLDVWKTLPESNEPHRVDWITQYVERIGQLLGKAPGRGKKEISPHADSFHRERRWVDDDELEFSRMGIESMQVDIFVREEEI